MSCMLLGPEIVNGMINCVMAHYLKTDSAVFKLPRSIERGYGEFMAETKIPTIEQLTALGKLLIRANEAGFSATYDGRYDSEIDDTAETYEFSLDPYARGCDVGWFAKQKACFEYQADAAPDYETSEAARWLAWAQSVMLESLLTYKTAPWGYEGQPDAA